MYSFLTLQGAVHRLRALGEPTRLRLAHLLSYGELTVTEITKVLGQSQPRVSRHLKLLLEAGCVERFPEGACVFYRLAEELSASSGLTLVHMLVDTLDTDDTILAGDRERLAQVKAARLAAANDYFEAHAEEWNRIRELYQPVAKIEKAMLDLLGPEQVDLLIDLGTGTGRVLEALSTVYRKAIGFDVNQVMLRLARVNLDQAGIRHAHVRYGNLLSPPPVDRADIVVIHQVLHYMDNPGAALRSAAGLLAPRGRLLLIDFLPHEVESLRATHAHRRLGFGDEEFRRLCREAGLEPEASVRIDPAPASTGDEPQPAVSVWLARRSGSGPLARAQTASDEPKELRT